MACKNFSSWKCTSSLFCNDITEKSKDCYEPLEEEKLLRSDEVIQRLYPENKKRLIQKLIDLNHTTKTPEQLADELEPFIFSLMPTEHRVMEIKSEDNDKEGKK